MKKKVLSLSATIQITALVCCSLSVNTFSAASGDFAKAAAIFLPLLPTTPRKAKMTVICGNFSLFLTKPYKPE